MFAEIVHRFAPALRVPMHCDAVSLFVEPSRGAPLVLTHRFALSDA